MQANTPPVEPARNYGPRGIAALVAPVLRPALRRRGAALAILIEDWPAIVGTEIAARSLPVKCAAGTLTLGCSGPDSVELQHRVPELIGRINRALGGDPVTRLRFVDLAVPVAAVNIGRGRKGDRAVSGRAPATGSVELPDGPLGDALARLRRGMER